MSLKLSFTCHDDSIMSIIQDFWDEQKKSRTNNNKNGDQNLSPLEYPIQYSLVYTGEGKNSIKLEPQSPTISTHSVESDITTDSCMSLISLGSDLIDIPYQMVECIGELPILNGKQLSEALTIIENPSIETIPSKIFAPLKNVQPSKDKEVYCIACEKYYIDRTGLRRHFQTNLHKKCVKDSMILDPVGQPEAWVVLKYFCFICEEGFGKEIQLANHIIGH